MPDSQATDIAVQGARIQQISKDIASIEQNVEKIANGQEIRLRDLETHKAQAEERWENHWKAHVATSEAMDKSWADHAIAHDDLKTKQRLADIIGSGTALIAAAIAAVFGVKN